MAATVPRSISRSLPRVSGTSTSALRLATRSSRQDAANQFFRNTSRRQFSSTAQVLNPNTSRYLAVTAGAAVFGAGVYFLAGQQQPFLPWSVSLPSTVPVPVSEVHTKRATETQPATAFKPTPADYQQVYNTISTLLWENDSYDDGSYGPILLRLAWHASGTYDVHTHTGGSNGATMRFASESSHAANAGLHHARAFLEPVKSLFPWLSYGDLWTLAAVCAVREMGGPEIPWRPGRVDHKNEVHSPPDGRLPNGSKTQNHLRDIFGRMGFDDREIVALSGAHALGRCHPSRSGFSGPWTFSPTVFTNEYFRLLIEEEWEEKQWDGPKQYQDKTTGSLMMLPSDMALVRDEKFREHVERYARDEKVFFDEFAQALGKLFELGVGFGEESQRVWFRSSAELEEEKEQEKKGE